MLTTLALWIFCQIIVCRSSAKLPHLTTPTTLVNSTENEDLRNVDTILTLAAPKILLFDYEWAISVGKITVGTPPQIFDVIMDTSSSDMWLPGNNMMAYPKCYEKAYQTGNSSTSSSIGVVASFTSGYCYGYGTTWRDLVCLSTVCSLQQELIEGQQINCCLNTKGYHGVVGLAFPTISSTQALNPVQSIAELGLLPKPIFTIWKSQLADKSLSQIPSGQLTLGDEDSMHCTPGCLFVDVAGDYWRFTLDKAYVLGQKYPSSKSRKFNAITSSSTSYIMGPNYDVLAMVGQMKAWYSAALNRYVVDCAKIAGLPNMIFTINNITYPVLPLNYVSKDPKSGSCIVKLLSITPTVHYDWILGEPWQRQYCHVYNFKLKKLGFCLPKM